MKTNLKKLFPLFLIPLLAAACTFSLPFGQTGATDPAELTDAPLLPVTAQQSESQTVFIGDDAQANLIDVYARVNPAVVHLTVYANFRGQLVSQGLGSGFVIDSDGHIVTNAHVVQGADAVDVIFSDDTILPGTVVGMDLHSDLAVVKVDSLPQGVEPLALGNSDSLAVGQTVVAIGNPYGLDGTLTRGIISALGRTISSLTSFSIPQAIQTDAAINPGNSGGPLLDLNGNVIGVNAQIETGSTSASNSGVGFAIPVNIVKLVVPDLIEKGEHEWAWLGVTGGTLNTYQAQAMNLDVTRAAYLSEIVRGGPAAKAGLRGSTGTQSVDGRTVEIGGDVITAVDGEPVSSFDDILLYIAFKAEPGQTIKLTVIRDGAQQEVDVTLEPRPQTVN
ncbi:MAG: trypsin-like serine protease [Chloroflexi bacterium]|nr:trypsin-like serine protease [Chloroflexota bacterium]